MTHDAPLSFTTSVNNGKNRAPNHSRNTSLTRGVSINIQYTFEHSVSELTTWNIYAELAR